MSTNFFWAAKMVTGKYVTSDDPDVHICKRYGIGGGNIGLTWAQDPQEVKAVCAAHPDELIVIDEYLRPYLGKDFLELILGAAKNDLESIGVWFS